MIENTHPRSTLIYRRVEGVFSHGAVEPRGPFEGEEQAKGEANSNRNNPIFRNRRNPMTIGQKAFSNRNKNTCFASPHFRPHLLFFLCLSACNKLLRRITPSHEVH